MKKLMLSVAALAAALCIPVDASAGLFCRKGGELKVVSYNIRVGRANDKDNSWQYRKQASVEMINDIAPDIFGLQECVDFQRTFLDENLSGYAGVGVGRDDGVLDGEQMAIFYNKKNIKLIKWGTFWLSETPETPSYGWDAACRRTATWALLKDKRSGKKFYFVNTHLDHKGKEARAKGLSLIVDRIKDINPEGWPMVLTGDFNVTPDDPCLKSLSGRMFSARETAPVTDHQYTYNGWGNSDHDAPIDYIYWSGFEGCRKFRVVTEEYGRKYVSDHYPIVATLKFK